MFARFWSLIQPKARGRFIALTVAVLLGGIVELAGIGVVAGMMQLVATAGKTAPAGPLGYLTNELGIQDSSGRLKLGLLFSIVVLGGVHGFTALRSYLRNRFVWTQDRELTSRLFSATLEQPYSYFLTRNTAELQHILLDGGVTQGVINGVLSVVGHLSIALTLVAALIWVDPAAALVGTVVVALAYSLLRRITREMLDVKGGQAHGANRQRRRVCQEALTGIRFVKTTGRESFFLDRFRRHSDVTSEGMVYHAVYVDLVRAFLEWVTFAGILTLSVYLVMDASDLDALLPRLTLYTMATYRIVPAIHELFQLWSRLRFDAVHLKDIVDILESPALGEAVAQKPLEGFDEERPLLSFQQVGFQYPKGDRLILDGIDLEIGRKEWIGIVGSTGAGKTTMLDLMAGLCTPTEGRILVGESTLSPEFMQAWRGQIGVVPQEVILLDDTLMRNIAFGLDSENIDETRVAEVCRAAGLEGLLSTLSDGYHTSLGERGLRLSGGERQRVGIARALYRQPQLLLLDEATSALDQATEARIVTTLRDLAKTCTLVTVAHRLSSVRPCDRILVMDHGKIAAMGSYDELVSESRIFQELAVGAC